MPESPSCYPLHKYYIVGKFHGCNFREMLETAISNHFRDSKICSKCYNYNRAAMLEVQQKCSAVGWKTTLACHHSIH